MLFSSLEFICLFFPVFFSAYFLAVFFSRLYAKKKGLSRVPTLARNAVLLVFSLIFYAFGEIKYILLLILSIAVNYLLALFIGKYREKKAAARTGIVLTVVFNLGLLVVFKYLSLFVSTANAVFGFGIKDPGLLLPIGISFFTFQLMSYVIDVYRGDVAAQKNIFIVAVYLSAFPQLIAGPIVRYADVEKELYEREETLPGIYSGLERFITGLAKKVVIANTVAVVADGIYSYAPSEYGVIGAWIAAVAYALQIYFDFSGYSDMAIGMGRMMGFRYIENFNHPYSASSVTDFWRRWHMSLSGFFRDYVYIPLGGNRVSLPRWIFNMMAVWCLTGFWHGASYNFALWGIYYGVLLILEKKVFKKFLDKHRIFSRVYTIFAFLFGWVIFRTEDVTKLGPAFGALFGVFGIGRGDVGILTILRRSECGAFFIAIAVIGIVLSMMKGETKLHGKFLASYDGETLPKGVPAVIGDVIMILLLVLSVVMLETNSYNPFIYFRF